jgi:hypothetical protein
VEPSRGDLQASYYSFLLRLWRAEGKHQVEWHSQVDHLATGRRVTFDTLEKLLDFLRVQTSDRLPDKGGGTS